MQRKPVVINKSTLVRASQKARDRFDAILFHAKEMAEDLRREERLEACKCRACYYTARIAGQCFTYQPCGLCHKDQTFSSTDTNAICLECAKEHDLCCHCSGDIDMRPRRRKWPEPAPVAGAGGSGGLTP